MDERRQQEYVKFTAELLACDSGEETALLQARPDLIDAGLVQVMESVAEVMVQRGDESGAQWLRNLARRVRGMLNAGAGNEEQRQFLIEVLQATRKSGGDAQVVYPLLQANLDKLDENFAEVLRQWGRETLAQGGWKAYSFASDIYSFNILMGNFPLGSRAANIELAIVCCELTLTVFTCDAYPENWAIVQNSLGIKYYNRIRGDSTQNRENAIACYSDALKIRTREAFPVDWAATQNNLGAAYGDRIRGDRAQNQENAIACLSDALKIRTREAFPVDWANTQNNLGNAYCERIRGDRALNLEKAIACYSDALKVYTREAFPVDWAMTQNNLGNAYLNRIRGDRALNLEKAIACYSDALKVYTCEAFPVDWARVQICMGVAYWDRIRGDRALNQENAIACFSDAQTVYTREAFPVAWAMTQNNLGEAYQALQNIPEAIKAYEAALTIRTPSAAPIQCLNTGHNLGNLGFSKGMWETAINGYEKAILAVEQSREWASSQRRKQEIVEEALDIYEKMVQACINARQLDKALETVERSKSRHLVELLANAELYPKGASEEIKQQLTELRRRISSAEQLLEAVEGNVQNPDSRGGGESQRRSETAPVSSEYLSQQRQILQQSQQQLDALLTDIKQTLDKDFTLTQRVEPISFEEIRRLLDADTALVQWHVNTAPRSWGEGASSGFQTFIVTRDAPPEVEEFDAAALSELETWKDEYLGTYGEPSWKNLLSERLQRLSQILRLDKIIARIPTTCRQVVLIPHRYLHLFPLHALPLSEKFAARIGQGEEFVFSVGAGEASANEDGSGDSEIISANASPLQVSAQAQVQGEEGFSSLVEAGEAFANEDSSGDSEIVSANASPLQAQGQEGFSRRETICLLDIFPGGIRYAPSCQLLQRVQNRQRDKADARRFFAIQNPTEDLHYTNLEVGAIQSTFAPHTHILEKAAATKSAFYENEDILRRAYCAHFSCHGAFNFQFPLLSGLILADSLEIPAASEAPASHSAETSAEKKAGRYLTLRSGRKANPEKCLTLREIFADIHLPLCRLVTLSACETGLISSTEILDECIGLPTGFLYAGSLSVLSSLWCVDDRATAFLMIKFYEFLQPDIPVAVALNCAQLWMRSVTQADFLTWMQQQPIDADFAKAVELWLMRYYPEDTPFRKPHYWAAFCASGQ